jgi:7-cyano-7-deazaguanine synthase
MTRSPVKAVVVLSGGQDSATCLALAVKKYGAAGTAAITFRYGQRHALETRYAKGLARHFGIARHQIVPLSFYGRLTSNALMDPAKPMAKKRGAACPNTVVEGRNAFFLLAASVWAKELGATDVYTGVSEVDFSGYPDCRAAFIRAQQRAARLAAVPQAGWARPETDRHAHPPWHSRWGSRTATRDSDRTAEPPHGQDHAAMRFQGL